jgi:hypothetical protein
MRGEDRNHFDTLMSRTGQIGGRGWTDIADKLAATQNWLANQEIEARFAILYKDIKECSQTTMYGSVSLRPAKYNVLSAGDISEFNFFTSGASTATLKTIEKLSIAQQWWDYTSWQYVELNSFLSGLTTNTTYSWMTQEDHTAFANARVNSTGCGSGIADMYISNSKVSEKKAAYDTWLANRQQFRTATIALEQFVVGMAPAELEAFNAAKSSMTYSMTNDISDMHNSTKSPTEKLAAYTQWLDAYRAAQVNA